MSMTSEDTTINPPEDLPTNPADFWGTPPGELLKLLATTGADMPVIDQLGSAPFKKPDKGGFPFLGFLASVFEHVSSTAMNELHAPPTPVNPGDATLLDETPAGATYSDGEFTEPPIDETSMSAGDSNPV